MWQTLAIIKSALFMMIKGFKDMRQVIWSLQLDNELTELHFGRACRMYQN